MWRFSTSILFLMGALIWGALSLSAAPAILHSTPTAPPTATPPPPRSLFVEDICAPPCWFGLTPGETAAQEVDALVQRFGNLFYRFRETDGGTYDPETGYMVNGSFGFFWNDFKPPVTQFPSIVRIRKGVVSSLSIEMNRLVYLEDALETLGSPESVVLPRPGLGFYDSLRLGYPELHLRVTFYVDNTVEACNTATIREVFWVNNVEFYDSPDILIIEEYTDRLVPPTTWQTWLNGEVGISCIEAWNQLPGITATPVPTATPTATPPLTSPLSPQAIWQSH